MTRHATDRVDFTYIAECSGDCDIEMSAEATNSEYTVEDLFPTDECPVCGEDWAFMKEEEPHEVLE